MMPKTKRKVRLEDYGIDYDALIEVYGDLPWPTYVIHDNKAFIHQNKSVGAVGYYRRDLSFYNTLKE